MFLCQYIFYTHKNTKAWSKSVVKFKIEYAIYIVRTFIVLIFQLPRLCTRHWSEDNESRSSTGSDFALLTNCFGTLVRRALFRGDDRVITLWIGGRRGIIATLFIIPISRAVEIFRHYFYVFHRSRQHRVRQPNGEFDWMQHTIHIGRVFIVYSYISYLWLSQVCILEMVWSSLLDTLQPIKQFVWCVQKNSRRF